MYLDTLAMEPSKAATRSADGVVRHHVCGHCCHADGTCSVRLAAQRQAINRNHLAWAVVFTE